MIGERTIGKYCPVRRMCWLHLYNPENFLIKSRQPVAQPVKIARAPTEVNAKYIFFKNTKL